MYTRCIMFIWRPITYVCSQQYHGWLVFYVLCFLKSIRDRFKIIAFIAQVLHMKIISFKTFYYIICIRERGITLNGDMVIVIQVDELSQSQVACHRGRFMRCPFHQVAVTAKNVGIVVNNINTFFVENGGKMRLSDRHTHRGHKALTERACSCFSTGCKSMLGMSCSDTTQLPEIFDLVQ